MQCTKALTRKLTGQNLAASCYMVTLRLSAELPVTHQTQLARLGVSGRGKERKLAAHLQGYVQSLRCKYRHPLAAPRQRKMIHGATA